MTTSDITKILERLAVIETKIDLGKSAAKAADDVALNAAIEAARTADGVSRRVRIIELVLYAFIAALAGDAAGIKLPFG